MVVERCLVTPSLMSFAIVSITNLHRLYSSCIIEKLQIANCNDCFNPRVKIDNLVSNPEGEVVSKLVETLEWSGSRVNGSFHHVECLVRKLSND